MLCKRLSTRKFNAYITLNIASTYPGTYSAWKSLSIFSAILWCAYVMPSLNHHIKKIGNIKNHFIKNDIKMKKSILTLGSKMLGMQGH